MTNLDSYLRNAFTMGKRKNMRYGVLGVSSMDFHYGGRWYFCILGVENVNKANTKESEFWGNNNKC